MDPRELELLRQSIDELITTNRAIIKNQSPWRSFTHGVVSAIGATVGAAIVIGLIAGLLHQLAGFDLFKPTVEKVLPYIDKTQRKADDTLERSLPAASYTSEPSPALSFESSPSP